jgi:Recombinase zinc beta ribbon domain
MSLTMPLDLIAYDPGRACYRPYQRYSHSSQQHGESLARQAGEGEDSDEVIAERLGLPLGPPMIAKAVSAFRAANLAEGLLGQYLRQIELRQVPEGDIIGIDEWSRLTRAPLDRAQKLLGDLIHAGVGIYVKRHRSLITRAVVRSEAGFMTLATALMYLQIAHNESATKSRYNRKTIGMRHEGAEEAGVIRSKVTPAWLGVTGGTFKEAIKTGEKRNWVLRDGPVYVVRRIFAEILYQGVVTIAEGLNRDWKAGDERCKPFGFYLGENRRSAGWHAASVNAILHNIAVKGLATRTMVHPETGKIIPDPEAQPYLYFPVIITDEEWNKAHAAIAARRKVDPDKLGRKVGKGGRRGYGVPNLFSRLLVCGVCGGPVTYYTARPGTNKRPRKKLVYSYLQCRSARMGTGCENNRRVAYEMVERDILARLRGVEATSKPAQKSAETEIEKEIAALTKRLTFITRRIAEDLEEEDEDIRLANRPKIKEWGAEKATILKRLEVLNRKLDEERGDGGPGEGVINIHRLQAQMHIREGDERAAIRTEMAASLGRVINKIVLPRYTEIVVTLGRGLGAFSVGERAVEIGMHDRMRDNYRDWLVENHPESVSEFDEERRRLGDHPPRSEPDADLDWVREMYDSPEMQEAMEIMRRPRKKS